MSPGPLQQVSWALKDSSEATRGCEARVKEEAEIEPGLQHDRTDARLLEEKLDHSHIIGDISVKVEHIKEEAVWSPRVSEVTASLYDNHDVKDEMVVGPEVLQPRDITYSHARTEPCKPMSEHNWGLRDCIVRIERSSKGLHQCKTCSKIFVCEAALGCHVRQHSVQDAAEKSINNSVNVTSSRKIAKIESVRKNRHHSVQDACNNSVKVKPRKTIKIGVTKKRNYKCDTCGQQYTSRSHIVKHLNTHSKNYECEICFKRFLHMRNLTCHLITHTGRKYFFCDICSKGYGLRHTLIRHIGTHTQERKFSCGKCSKQFAQRHGLVKHNRYMHWQSNKNSQWKPFTCEICSKEFIDNHHLARHNLTHTGEKPFSCATCAKRFALKHHLTRHTASHDRWKGLSCDICCEKFTYKSNLLMHKRMHTGEKYFSCEMCCKHYKSNCALKRHTHSRLHAVNVAMRQDLS